MKAYVLHKTNDLKFEEIEKPEISDTEVLIRVKAAGICGSDIPRIYETGAHSHPLIPGHEFSGQVIETGKLVNKKWKNKRVGVFPLIPCGLCTPCKNRQFEMCRNYRYLGSRCNGGFAEYAAVPEWNLIELPEKVTFEEAAMLEPMSVAIHAIRRIFGKKTDYPDPDKKICICGLGTIGLLILMFLKDYGFKNIFTIGNKDFQKEHVVQMGIKESNYLDSRKNSMKEWILEKTENEGVDVFFECVGKNETINLSLDSTSPGGKVMFVGNPCSDLSFRKDSYWKILRNQLTILGTWNSSFTGEMTDDWRYVLDCLEKNHVHPEKLISHKFLLSELQKGFEIMRDKTEDYVKIMAVF